MELLFIIGAAGLTTLIVLLLAKKGKRTNSTGNGGVDPVEPPRGVDEENPK